MDIILYIIKYTFVVAIGAELLYILWSIIKLALDKAQVAQATTAPVEE
ncbi:MAG: hypothetical protein GFH27_549285n90 [Chloroflexi bacterium AL-W]|nr:hypothetical protein [Chloroflexi bacterium AL-N1]NOK65602.1 hypothetical protein [Chloroflexi bacterium AL-N10]NOK74457.1 hypothetical protein [Chloroflexi bacterium AL-N5]NOK80635.1 hypothetical protein [Chloroflexi bacterium AL-W]NOK88715.1 hypothetical protein [Chloroflexi bacterium AL-N15]